ncbi:hypothetical protein DMENIID0001_146040 [Sergentomyia squamirostris]
MKKRKNWVEYMKPFLTHSRPTLLETLPVCCGPVARLLTTTEQLTQNGVTRRTDSDSDLCIEEESNYRGPGGSEAQPRRNSISRVSIRLVSDERNNFLASYKNRD